MHKPEFTNLMKYLYIKHQVSVHSSTFFTSVNSFSLTNNLMKYVYYYLHFKDDETKVQREYLPKINNYQVMKLEFEPMQSCRGLHTLTGTLQYRFGEIKELVVKQLLIKKAEI